MRAARRAVAGVALAATASLAGCGATTTNALPPFSITASPLSVSPGDSIDVTVVGCPPHGSLRADEPLVVNFAPVAHRNSWGAMLDDGRIVGASTAMFAPGETGAVATPKADGTAIVTIEIPADAPTGPATVKGLCSGLLRSSADDRDFDPASEERAWFETDPLMITTR